MKYRLRSVVLNGIGIALATSTLTAGNGKAPAIWKDATVSTYFGIKSGKHR